MHITQITTVFPPYTGGMGQVPYYYAEYLFALGHDVTVITPDYGHGHIQAEYDLQYVKPLFSWGLAAMVPRLFFDLNKHENILVHYPAYGMAEIVWLWWILIGKRQGKKLSIFYHMDTVAAGWLGWIFRIHRKLFLPLLLHSCSKVFFSTLDYARHSHVAKWLANNAHKVHELPFGVTESYTPGAKNLDLLRTYEIDPNKKIILFVGGMGDNHYFKGVSVLLHALQEIEDNLSWHGVFVGKGSRISEYTKKAEELGIAKRVSFVGFQNDAVMPDWYRTATVTVLPSTDMSEAFGIVLVEAMGCGSPIIASDLPGVRSVGTSETGFVFPVGDCRSLAQKLTIILSDQDLQQQMSMTAVKRVQDNYTWKKIVEKLVYYIHT